MTRDYMRRGTMMDWTAFDIGCGCYTPKHQAELKKRFRRSVRRTGKNSLKKFLTNA